MSRNGGKDLGDYIEEQYTGAGWNFWSRLGAEHRPQPYSGSGVPPAIVVACRGLLRASEVGSRVRVMA